MPIINTTKGVNLTPRVTVASNFAARLLGLLGTARPDPQKAFYLMPCAGVHTFGMKYPIDVVFLDGQGSVVQLFHNLSPNKITKIIPAAKSALELSPDTIKANEIQIGDDLKVIIDEHYHGDLQRLKRILHWPTNLFMCFLWVEFFLSSFLHWQKNGSVLNLGLLLVNTLLLLLFLTRRESTETSDHVLDWIIPISTVVLSMMLGPHPSDDHALIALATVVQLIGISGILSSLVCLGRSFGIVPASRKIKYAGVYKIVRHPLYASELIFYFGFVVGNFTAFNLLIVIAILFGQTWRAF
jgi:uncharacterized membrane protein (UPF0127 family)